MWNIIIGIISARADRVIGGLSGKLVLRGTNSSPALVVVAILLIWGLAPVTKRRGAADGLRGGGRRGLLPFSSCGAKGSYSKVLTGRRWVA